MHPLAITAWLRELEAPVNPRPSPSVPSPPSRKRARPNHCEGRQPRKTRRLVLAELAPNNNNKPESSSYNEDMNIHKDIEKKRVRTPSPQKRRFPTDAYSPPADYGNEPTPRPPKHHLTQPIPILSYGDTLTTIADELDSDGDELGPGLSLRSRTQSQPQSASTSSARSASPKKLTSLWDVGNGVVYTNLANTAALQRVQLGEAGLALLQTLEDASEGPVFAARLKERLSEAGIERIKPHQWDQADDRPMEELLHELHTVQTINALTHRCAENRDHESEWNNRVHTKVLELALSNDEVNVGFRSVTAARITTEFRPTHSPGLTTGKIVDYAMFLEPSRPARDAMLTLIGMSSQSVNHVSYEGLRTRPIAVSIETKTESRTVEEAKVQLGVWLAAQVARIEGLIQQIVLLKAKNSRAERARLEKGKGDKDSQSQTQQPTPTPTIDVVNPDVTHLMSQIVFPLLDVQSETWSLFFGRVSIPSNMSDSRFRKPTSHIQIFQSVALGNTANTAQTYRLVKNLRVLRAWVDVEFRQWWDKILDVNEEVGKDMENKSN